MSVAVSSEPSICLILYHRIFFFANRLHEGANEDAVSEEIQPRSFYRSGPKFRVSKSNIPFSRADPMFHKRHKVRDRKAGFARFGNQALYKIYGLYKVPTTAGWTKAHALK